MAHLTYFDTIEEYNAYINSEDYVKPNISYCADVDAVFMKEDFVPSMSAVFNITSTGTTPIANTVNGIKAIRVDGQLLAQNSAIYTFTTTGNHTVEYQFRRQNSIANEVFYNIPMIASVDLTNISNTGNKNFNNCPNLQLGDFEFDGNVGDNCFWGLSSLTSIIINGNMGNNNISGDNNLTSVRVNGNIGNGNIAGVTSLTDVYIDGNVENSNFGGVDSITSMTINGSVGISNYFYGFDTLHIKGDYGGGGYLSNVKHLIVEGNMVGSSVHPGSGLEDIVIKGNLGNGNFGGISTLSAITISGNVGDSNFGGCSPINTMKIGGNVGNSNFSNGSHAYELVEIGGNVQNGNNFVCNTGMTSIITISGSVEGGSTQFYSGNTLTIKGDCGNHSIYYWNNVTIEGSLTGSGVSFTGVKNVRIKGDVTGGGNSWGTQSGINKESFIIDGSIVNGGCFNGITGPMVQVGGSIGSGCFQSINVTDVTTYTVNGSVGSSCFNDVSGLTSVTVDGNVGANSFGITGGSSSNSITSLTLTENCTSFGGFETTSVTNLTIQATTPPTLENEIPNTVTIYVPTSAVDTYKVDADWGVYSSQIQAIPNE